MHLGIDKDSGWVYEGLGGPEIPMPPGVTITQAKLIITESDWRNLPRGLQQEPFHWVFREDGFDAVTRTRRGRLYQANSTTQPSSMLVAEHRYEVPSESNTSRRRNLFTYVACTTLLQQPRQGVGHMLALGNHTSASAWRIIHVEMLVNGCVMLWLKSKSAFTMIPEIDYTKIDIAFRDDVDSAVNRVLDSAFRETAISVVDHCRNALTVIVSRWIFQQSGNSKILSKDLAPLATLIEKEHDKNMVSCACQIVARLHSRGKDNERISKELRSPQDGDADFAIDSVGLVLRDLGWARP